MIEDDAELLRRYADEKSNEAFAELVQRHLKLVYSVALRQVAGDAHLAEDVTQQVFTALARKARALAGRPALSGWLYRSTHFAASDVVRVERRRRAREEEAHIMNEFSPSPVNEAEWDRVRPTIDAAIAELDERDRDAVSLRFFGGCSFADIGARLRLSENAARMRVERALDKLHAALARRGVTSTTTALGVALAQQAGAAVPAGLAVKVTGAAVAGFLTFMGMSKTTMGVVTAVALAGMGVAIYEVRQAGKREAELAAVAPQAAWRAKVAALESRIEVESSRAREAEADNATLLAAVEVFQAEAAARMIKGGASITRETVEARYRRAQELAKSGQAAEALREFLWCYDEGMPRFANFRLIWMAELPNQILRLGRQYPGALEALRERRDAAEARYLAGSDNAESIGEVVTLSGALGEPWRILAMYEKIPESDVRRAHLGAPASSLLANQGRYAEALRARPFAAMSRSFESSLNACVPAAATVEAEKRQQANRLSAINGAVKSVEVLAGAGALSEARALAGRLLAFDGTDATRALLQKHLARAGQPGLLATVVPKS